MLGATYHIVENFRERKLHKLVEEYDFSGENFRRCSFMPLMDATHAPKFHIEKVGQYGPTAKPSYRRTSFNCENLIIVNWKCF